VYPRYNAHQSQPMKGITHLRLCGTPTAYTSPRLVPGQKWLQDDVPVPRMDASQVRRDPRVHHVPATWKICTPMPWPHGSGRFQRCLLQISGYSCIATCLYHGNVRAGNEYDAHPVDQENFSVGFYCRSLGTSCPAYHDNTIPPYRYSDSR
jgi:hypothetical protein